MLIDVEQRDATDTHLQQAFDIGIDQFTYQLFAEGFEPIAHGGQHRFIGFALLDFFIDALLDENAFERAKVQFILEFGFPQLELALERLDQLLGVGPKHIGNGHFDRPIVFDDDDAASNGDLAIGEGVKSINQLLSAHAAGRFDLDLYVYRGEIIDALDLNLAFARGILDGGH